MSDKNNYAPDQSIADNIDQKANFDNGYNAYETGTIGKNVSRQDALDNNKHHTMWRLGWERAREDSCMTHYEGLGDMNAFINLECLKGLSSLIKQSLARRIISLCCLVISL